MSDLEKPQFIETDVQTVLDECIAEYERLTGRPLYPAQSERLLINLIAYREHLVSGFRRRPSRTSSPSPARPCSTISVSWSA